LNKTPEYRDQSALDLRFTLSKGALDKHTFNVLVEGTLGGRIGIEAGVIGASHFVSYLIEGRGVLNEVFACGKPDPLAKAHWGPLGEISGAVDLSFPELGVTYRFEPVLNGWQEAQAQLEKLEHTIAENNETRRQNALGLRFDFPADGAGRIPKTLVWVQQRSEYEVRVATAHCYPHEDRIVLTRSSMTLTPRSVT